MEKDTKTFKCDACKKTLILDFYDESTAQGKKTIESGLAGWITLEVSLSKSLDSVATTKSLPNQIVVTKIVGHACSEECIETAIANVVEKKMKKK